MAETSSAPDPQTSRDVSGVCVVALVRQLGRLERTAVETTLGAVEGERASFSVAQDPARGHLVGEAQVGPHRVGIVGLAQPAPAPLVQRTTELSHWDPAYRQALLPHQAHLMLEHLSGPQSPLERYLALYKVAVALGGDDLLGVLNEAAWTFNPGGLVQKLLEPEILREVRRQLPPNIWTGFFPVPDPEGIWFVSKGHHVFGAPDLVFLGDAQTHPTDVLDMFMNVLLYVLERRPQLEAGHTLSLSQGRLMLLQLPPEHPKVLHGPVQTLRLVRVDSGETSFP